LAGYLNYKTDRLSDELVESEKTVRQKQQLLDEKTVEFDKLYEDKVLVDRLLSEREVLINTLENKKTELVKRLHDVKQDKESKEYLNTRIPDAVTSILREE